MWAFDGRQEQKTEIEAAVINPHLRGMIQIYIWAAQKHRIYKHRSVQQIKLHITCYILTV